MIPCCDCGVSIEPNAENGNKCIDCRQKHIDFTERRIPKQTLLHFCRGCERYLQPPSEWVTAARESRELLAVCLAQLKKLNDARDLNLADARFVWTEPHSKRLRVQLTVHGAISGGRTKMQLQQVFFVEFTIQNRMCDVCHRVEAKDYWRCLVQLRQRAENKKTLYYLEQLVLKHKAHGDTLGIKPENGGLDFYFANEQHARKFVEFLQTSAPVKVSLSKRLMSLDLRNNCFDNRCTWSVEITPLSSESLVCLPSPLRQQLGNIGAICLVHKVAGGIHLIDPCTAQISEMSGNVYFRAPFEAICNPKRLVEYIVMDVEIIPDKDRKIYPGQGQLSMKHALCDIWLVRSSVLGINENTIHTRSHLGHLLHVGDSVLGYNVSEANINNAEFEKLSSQQVPDVVLVRKIYTDRLTRSNERQWKLKHLADEATDERSKHDYHEFLEDLEEDPEYRKNINIYRDDKKLPVKAGVASKEVDVVLAAEMLQDFSLDCVEVDVEAVQKPEGAS